MRERAVGVGGKVKGVLNESGPTVRSEEQVSEGEGRGVLLLNE